MRTADDINMLFHKLSDDAWRRSNPFNLDLARAQAKLLRSDLASDAQAAVLDEWIRSSQPCLFARFAAAHGLLHYTVVHEAELLRDPESAVERVRAARRDIGRLLYLGRSMGWVLVIVSRTLAHAAPDSAARELATFLFRLLIRGNPSGNDRSETVELDRIWLRDQSNPARPMGWDSPYNFFAAQADGRSWTARRFPAGWAFSLNSVGHNVAARLIPPAAGLDWAQNTMMRTPGASVSLDRCSYTCEYDTDSLLPAEFFEREQRRRHGPFAFTQIFDYTERSAIKASWSQVEARTDGRAFRGTATDLWFD